MKQRLLLTIAIMIIATTALWAQTGDIVKMKATNAFHLRIRVEYSGTGSITANGKNLINGSFTGIGYISSDLDSIVTITTTGNIVLTYLYIWERTINELNVSQAIYLTNLYCGYNPLTQLDLTQNTALTHLYCRANQLTELDVTNNTALTYLYCGENQLTELDLTNNMLLEELYCYDNLFTQFDVSNNTALIALGCSSNPLTQLDVTHNKALTYLSYSGSQLTELDLTNNTALEILHSYYCQLTELDLSNNTALKTLDCYYCQLTKLDLSNNTALEELRCRNSPLTQLNVTNNSALKELYCYNNQLTQLDVTNNTELTLLQCGSNQLTQLDVTNNTALTYLNCGGNQISSLDLKNLKLWHFFGHNQAVEAAFLEGATTFTNPIYYHNETAVENAIIGGSAYAYMANVPMSSGNTFTTDISYSGYSFGGTFTFVPGAQVTFHSNGGTEIEPIAVKIGGLIGKVICERPGHSIEGWYTEETLVNKWNLETDTITTSMTLYAKWLLGIDDFETPTLNIYPNPASGNVTLTGIKAGDNITITDLSGRQVMQVRATAEIQTIDISNLRAGVYLVNVGNGVIAGKLIVR